MRDKHERVYRQSKKRQYRYLYATKDHPDSAAYALDALMRDRMNRNRGKGFSTKEYPYIHKQWYRSLLWEIKSLQQLK